MEGPDGRSHPGELAIAAAGILLVIASVATRAAGARQIVENPAKPRASNAGRVITLTEVLAICNEGASEF